MEIVPQAHTRCEAVELAGWQAQQADRVGCREQSEDRRTELVSSSSSCERNIVGVVNAR